MPMSGNRLARSLAQFACIAALLVFIGLPAWADSEDDPDFYLSVPGVRALKLDRTSLQFTPGAQEMEAGWTQQQVLLARVSANVEWALKLSGTVEQWEGPWDKPVGDIHWKCGGGGYTALTLTEAVAAEGGPCNQQTVPLHFRIRLDWANDTPGEYTYSYILIEVTQP